MYLRLRVSDHFIGTAHGCCGSPGLPIYVVYHGAWQGKFYYHIMACIVPLILNTGLLNRELESDPESDA